MSNDTDIKGIGKYELIIKLLMIKNKKLRIMSLTSGGEAHQNH